MSKQLFEKFKENITRLGLIQPNEKVLLTVSGGIDSISLFNLFIETKIDFAVAHCNFQLRGAESDGDQQFVENLAAQHSIACYTIKFNTKEYAAENRISIQMAARDLRYNWFGKIASENGYNKIATAHNLNDVVETFFINLTRGTGLKGLTGIKPINGKIIRPLLFASRKEIEEYSREKEIRYREDSSNAETKYLRNAIRHKIIPEFEKLNPSFLQSVIHASTITGEANLIFENYSETIKNKLLQFKDGLTYINIARLKEHKISPEFFFEIIREFGFSFDTVVKIIENLDSQPGLSFYSEKYQLIKDRKELIIKQLTPTESKEYFIDRETNFIEIPINAEILRFKNSTDFTIQKDKCYAAFDLDKLTFPLKLRKWHEGDFFYPFGGNGRKKISDYFTDHKFNLFDKENTWLLVSGCDILWIVGHRTDNRYRISEKTKEIIQFKLID